MDELKDKYGNEYFPHRLRALQIGVHSSFKPQHEVADDDYDLLTVSEEQFDAMASAIRSFWERFPERLCLS